MADLDPRAPRPYHRSVAASPHNGDRQAGNERPVEGRLSRWTGFWRRTEPKPAENPDLLVALWKAAWSKGAAAGWNALKLDANPYGSGRERLAWDAGWRWSQHNPDRRNDGTQRMAHRYRRADDSTPHLTRTLRLGAVGVSVFLLSRALHRWAKAAPRTKPDAR